jgi:pilus assembly protein CpaC
MDSPFMRRCALAPVVMLFLFITIFPTAVRGGEAKVILQKAEPQKLSLTVGKSVIVNSSEPVKRVSLGSQDIADAIVLTPQQISVIGKASGVTNLILWGADDKISSFLDIQVSPDVSRLGEMIQKILPEEKNLRIDATHDSLTLSGTVSRTSSLSQALALAEVHLPKDGKILNLVEVAGVHQVMLEVRVAEISKAVVRRLGFNFNYLGGAGKGLGIGLLNQLTRLPDNLLPSFSAPNPMEVSDPINAIFRFLSKGTTWTVFVDALKERGLVKVLAEPTLITLSGKTANFLAGGEFPVPVPQPGSGGIAITIEYKPFGVGLHFTPTVLSNKKISMEVSPEVSDLDFTTATLVSGLVIPGLSTRRVSTTIELADGQSFAIAGLLKDDLREIASGYPILGDIPILGALFRSTSFRKNETELIIIVTPHLVKPLDMTKQTLPTDQYIEPDDFEFYLLGHLEGEEKPGTNPKRSQRQTPGLEGSFGHILPK